jgi:hypothetical protein
MNYADLIWQTPSPNLRLQVLVKKKWKNLASALPYTSDRGTSEFPYAYDLKYAFPKAGTYYLRIYQDPHSFKGKKYGAYIGKQFWQRISP